MIGQNLKNRRKEQQLTQKALAEKTALSLPTIGQLEKGKGTIKSLKKVLNTLECEFFSNQLEPNGAIGERIQTLRKKKKISQQVAGGIIRATQSTISNIENHSTGRISTLEALVRVSGCELQILRTNRKKSFYKETALTSLNEVWTTPPHIIESLIDVFGVFDLDPCSETSDNKKRNSRAKIGYTAKDNGLKKPWFGTVFVNPPYGRTVGQWVEKCYSEAKKGNTKTVIGLLASRTDTKYFHHYISEKADIYFIKGRLKFGDGTSPAPFPSILVVWTSEKYNKEKLKSLING